MYWEQNIEYAAVSDIGFRRRNNQDSYCVHIADNRDYWNQRGHLFLVADGMGGHAVGELASKIAADTIPHTFEKLRDRPLEDALREAVITGNHAIYERGELNRDFARMGTTCTTLVLHPRGASVAHVGDSRAYRIRGDRIEQLTFDHSLQWELLRQGRMSPEEIFLREPRNVITRSLGPNAEVLVDVEGPYPVLPHDAYLLCSDGLSTLVKDEEMGVIVRELPPAEACQFLVDLANLRGGTDNITVVVVRVGRAPAGAGPSRPLRLAVARGIVLYRGRFYRRRRPVGDVPSPRRGRGGGDRAGVSGGITVLPHPVAAHREACGTARQSRAREAVSHGFGKDHRKICQRNCRH
jgi:PPM family protein phosphatase